MMSLLHLLPLFISGVPLFAAASPTAAADPCAAIAGKPFVIPADVLACYKSFPFNETIRHNVINNAARVLDFFTFEDYYYNSPPPFEDSTVNIRGKIAQFSSQKYKTDYDFHWELYRFSTKLNDGHTRYFPKCYTAYQSILPTPFIALQDKQHNGIYIAPDTVEFISLLPPTFTSYFESGPLKFDWKRLAGAKVLSIEDENPWDYVDDVAENVSGNYLDHGVRVNSVFTSYRLAAGTFSQRLGDLAGPVDVSKPSVKVTLVPVNATKPETVHIPFVSSYTAGLPFTDSASYYANLCAANAGTNGVDVRSQSGATKHQKKRPMGTIIDQSKPNAVNLPPQYFPTIPSIPGEAPDAIRSYILPDNKTGVLFVGSFEPDSFFDFQFNVVSAINAFKAANVTKLLIDLTNNGGGYVCLGHYLFQYLAGTKAGYPGFVSTQRGNPLAQKIVAAYSLPENKDVDLFYNPVGYAFLNGTRMPKGYNYDKPVAPFFVNGRSDPTSQRFHDTCETDFFTDIPEEPPFDPKSIAIVGNGNCASTCALFSTLMAERLKIKIATFGGRPGESIEYKGMAGNQVLEWPDLDTEIKSVGLKNDTLAPPDLIVNSNFRVNWRTAWSWLDEKKPIAYLSEESKYRFPYTIDTYNNPQNLWTFAASKLL